MADIQKPIGADPTGYEVLTKAVFDLLGQYPGLDGRKIRFEELDDNSGLAFSADNGALVMAEKRMITGKVVQNCQYPFYVVYRIASTQQNQKLQVQTFLDSLGKWLCGEPAMVNGEFVCLDQYPELTQGRRIEKVTRLNSYGTNPDEKGVQDWVLPVTVQYVNEIQPK